MPIRQTACAGEPAISRSRKRIEPSLGLSEPEMRLNVVLLPDPLGPMSPRISPSRTSKETWLTARNPSKRFVSPETASTSAHRVGGRFRQRQHGIRGLETRGADDSLLGGRGEILHQPHLRPLVLAGEWAPRRRKLDAEALHGAACGDIDLQRRLADRLGIDAAVLLDRDRHHALQQGPGPAEAHGGMGWRILDAG